MFIFVLVDFASAVRFHLNELLRNVLWQNWCGFFFSSTICNGEKGSLFLIPEWPKAASGTSLLEPADIQTKQTTTKA